MIGPSKSIKVLPGDQIEMEVYAKYLHYDPSVAGDALLSGFMGAFMDAGSEFLIREKYVDEGLLAGLENIVNNGQDYEGVPQAYLNYILFDKNYEVIEGKKLQISEEGKFVAGDTVLGPHEHLQIDPVNIAKEGYIYIYLSSQTPGSEVYFDDFYIKHTQNRVIQKDDYYPFGLSIEGLNSSRENSLANNYLYQGKEFQKNINIFDFEWRSYDPIIGRTWQIDPHSENYYDLSTFNWTGNNPILNIDPNGMDWYSNDETGVLVWHDPVKNDDGTTNTYLEGHTYLSGANADFDDVKNTYEFLNGSNTFGGDNLMTFLDHVSKNSSEKEIINTLSQIAGIAFGDENGEGNIKPTGFTAEYMEMADGSTLLSAISGASAGILERGKGLWMNTAEGLNKVRDIFAEFDFSFSRDSKITAKTLLDKKEYGVDSIPYRNVLLIVDYENDSITRVTPNPMGANVTGWHSKSTKGKWVNDVFKAP